MEGAEGKRKEEKSKGVVIEEEIDILEDIDLDSILEMEEELRREMAIEKEMEEREKEKEEEERKRKEEKEKEKEKKEKEKKEKEKKEKEEKEEKEKNYGNIALEKETQLKDGEERQWKRIRREGEQISYDTIDEENVLAEKKKRTEEEKKDQLATLSERDQEEQLLEKELDEMDDIIVDIIDDTDFKDDELSGNNHQIGIEKELDEFKRNQKEIEDTFQNIVDLINEKLGTLKISNQKRNLL